MKNIFKGVDDLYYIIRIDDAEGKISYPSDFDTFAIRAFTNNPKEYIEFTSDDITDDVLYMSASKLSELRDGPLKLKFIIGIADEHYDDGEFTMCCDRMTGYFLKKCKN